MEKKLVWHNVTEAPFTVYGGDRNFHRMPPEVSEKVSEGVHTLNLTAPAGIRVRFATDSDSIAVRCRVKGSKTVGFDLYELICGEEIFSKGFRSDLFMTDGDFEARRVQYFEKRVRYLTLNFPYFGQFDYVEVGLDEDAELLPGKPYINEAPVVFYGSSITMGAWASRPGNTYEALISQKYNLNYINLGFAGRAKGEPQMAEYIASLPMTAFVLDYDHNAKDYMELGETHEPFYRIVREKNPELPIFMLTRPDCFDYPISVEKRRAVIHSTYEKAVSEGDKNVYFLDGATFFSGTNYHNCTRDGTHPNDIGFLRMSEVIGDKIAEVLGLPNKKFDCYERV